MTSSHFASAERQFRFPLGYGNQRPLSATTTVTGSGCGCSAITLCGVILDKILKGDYEKVLFVPTGALMSTVGTHEGNSIPSIAHAIMLKGVR